MKKFFVETRKVLEKFSANGAVIVSDGEDDESVIPVIQNVLTSSISTTCSNESK